MEKINNASPGTNIPFMNVALNVLEKLERGAVYLSVIMIFVMMILTSLDTFLRDVLNSPLAGVYELHSMMMVGVLYLGLAYAQSKRSHIRMDILPSHMDLSNQSLLQVMGDAVFLFIAALIVWRMGIETWIAWTTGDFLYGIVRFPLWPAKLAITLGTALLSLRLITDIVRNPIWFTRPDISTRRHYLNIAMIPLGLILLVGITLIVKNLELSPLTVGWSVLVLFIILLFIGLPVAPSMAIIGILGIWIMSGSAPAFNVAGTIPFSASAEYTMTVMPLFIVMGTFAALAGFAESGFDLAKSWLVGIRGGIVHATIVGSTIFAAATGSGAASCVVLTRLTLPEMLKSGVRKGMAIGVIASASTLAIMIPPSTSFVIYAMMTGNSTGKLLIAGIIPGLIGAAMIMLTVFLRCQFDPSQVQPLSRYRVSWKERFAAFPRAWGIALVVLVIVGGIFTGVFTPTEAGAVGAFVTFIAVLALRKAGARSIFRVLLDSAGITSVILFILVGGMLFGNMISITRLPTLLSSFIVSLDVPPLVILIIIMFFYFVVGCFMDSLSIMIITLPIIYPVIVGLGFDPIWFGVLQVQNLEISVITPPYGMNLFILKGLLPDTNMTEIFRGVLWFIVPLVATMAIYIAFPQTALWLPSLMSK